MYLVDREHCTVKPVWLYSHEQFVKRPPDKDLKAIIQAILED